MGLPETAHVVRPNVRLRRALRRALLHRNLIPHRVRRRAAEAGITRTSFTPPARWP